MGHCVQSCSGFISLCWYQYDMSTRKIQKQVNVLSEGRDTVGAQSSQLWPRSTVCPSGGHISNEPVINGMSFMISECTINRARRATYHKCFEHVTLLTVFFTKCWGFGVRGCFPSLSRFCTVYYIHRDIC